MPRAVHQKSIGPLSLRCSYGPYRSTQPYQPSPVRGRLISSLTTACHFLRWYPITTNILKERHQPFNSISDSKRPLWNWNQASKPARESPKAAQTLYSFFSSRVGVRHVVRNLCEALTRNLLFPDDLKASSYNAQIQLSLDTPMRLKAGTPDHSLSRALLMYATRDTFTMHSWAPIITKKSHHFSRVFKDMRGSDGAGVYMFLMRFLNQRRPSAFALRLGRRWSLGRCGRDRRDNQLHPNARQKRGECVNPSISERR